ncbi:MAG: CshA/CshB family fibrillar adhesin-related protein [Actinomycetaceae bacterium]|nr:CshA/CshB family fibrillar adhesin-related protein [Arcanobacterium sp.]MDD7505688.1 CshA/CshB family fibrillar adhesin-related protein [Actinomycetaceae bacterium]MDY6143176.1 CshA/CshB family fibrillar adhesin-related protein [Arcanobacterium sp.]
MLGKNAHANTRRKTHRTRTVRAGIVSVLASMLLLLTPYLPGVGALVTPQAHAVYGSDGDQPEPYLNMINWIDWSSLVKSFDRNGKANDFIRNDSPNRSVTSRQVLNPNAVLETTCDVKKSIYIGTSSTLFNGNAVDAYIPGGFAGDAWDNFYGSGMAVGIGADQDIRFDVECTVTLIRDGERIEVQPQGLVFAGAESLDGGEYVNITPARKPGAAPTRWRLLEYQTSQACTNQTRLYLGNGDATQRGAETLSNEGLALDWANTVQMGSRDSACTRAGNFTPFINLYAEGASGAHIVSQARGGNFVAIGVAIGQDFGDAPRVVNAEEANYGSATALAQAGITGGTFPQPTGTVIKGYMGESVGAVLAQSLTPVELSYTLATPRLGELAGDLDSAEATWPTAESTWYTVRGDDDNRIDDEDAVDDGLITVARANTNYSLSLTCSPATSGTTHVAGWIDWNLNGTFDAGGAEKALTTCDAGTNKATLTWSVTDAMFSSKAPGVYESVLRLVATSDPRVTTSGASVSMFIDGEVEDHAISLVYPGVTAVKRVVDASGAVAADPQLASGWELTARSLTNGAGFIDGGTSQRALSQTTQAGAAGATSAPLEWLLDASTNAGPVDLASDLSPSGDISIGITETQKRDTQGTELYQLYPAGSGGTQANAACAVRERPSTWRDSWMWPQFEAPQLGNATDGFTLTGLSEHSIIDCALSNQPYGSFGIRATINGANNTGVTPDPGLRFSGTWQCVPPATSPYAGEPLGGTWGPVAATTASDDYTQTLVFGPSAGYKIPLGSECTVTQTAVTNGDVRDAPPVAGNDAVAWDRNVWYGERIGANLPAPDAFDRDPITISATSEILNEQLITAVVQNRVVTPKTAQIAWSKVDQDGNPLAGATFNLVYVDSQGVAVGMAITDCVADSVDACNDEDVDPAAGRFLVKNAHARVYTLGEGKPPAGYQLSGQTARIDLKASGMVSTSGDIVHTLAASAPDPGFVNPGWEWRGEFVNAKLSAAMLPSIPLTGGLGTLAFIIAAIIISAATLASGAGAIKQGKTQISSQGPTKHLKKGTL